MEEILEAWKMYVEQEEEAPEIKNEKEGKDEDGLVQRKLPNWQAVYV